MNSTLTLIYGSQVLPERNFKVPSLDDIVSQADTYATIQDFMYVKHAMDLTIKVDMSQVLLNFSKSDAYNLNYVIIQNISLTPQRKVGYFVVDKKWLSESTIELTLHCDVVNTFIDDCELSDKTRILRQHKDRFSIDKDDRFDYVDSLEIAPVSYITDEASWELNEQYELDEDQVGVALYDLSLRNPQYTNTDSELVSLDIDISIGADLSCYVYFADENYKIIGSAFLETSMTDTHLIVGYNSNHEAVQIWADDDHFTEPEIIPQDAKYIAFKVQKLYDGANAQMYLYPQDFEDLDVAYQEQLIEDMENLKYISQQGDWHDGNPSQDRYYRPIVDRYSEGIQPELFGNNNVKCEETRLAMQKSWYLIYENQNDPGESLTNPVDVYLCGSNSTKVTSWEKSDATWSYDEMVNVLLELNNCANAQEYRKYFAENNVNMLFITRSEDDGRVVVSGDHLESDFPDIDCSLSTGSFIGFLLNCSFSSNELLIGVYQYDEFGKLENFQLYMPNSTYTFTNIERATYGWPTARISLTPDVVIDGVSKTQVRNFPVTSVFLSSGVIATIYPITSVDRTNPKLIKIIELPYCPANVVSSVDDAIIFGSEWSYNAGKHMLKLNDYSTKLNRYLSLNNTNPLEPLKPRPMYDEEHRFIIYKYLEKSPDNEPKLYHSDYYYTKFFYDSFGYIVQLELISEWKENFRTIYYVSNTTNSRFMFAFPDASEYGKEKQDFNTIMYVGRNNEIALFNQQYVNYIRNGYNYDLKSKEIAEEQIRRNELFTIGGNIASTVVGSIRQGTSQQYMSMANSLTQFGLNTFSQIYNNIDAIQQKEIQMSAKLNQLRNQSTGVIDANDVDMMEAYARNRLQYKVYQCSPKMKQALFNLFYYTGYVADIQGIPDTTSRIWFNFVQADVVFKKVPNLPTSYINELKSKYNEGITFLHKNTLDAGEVIDFDQHYENWETKFFEE